jgi:hypothetical protein
LFVDQAVHPVVRIVSAAGSELFMVLAKSNQLAAVFAG